MIVEFIPKATKEFRIREGLGFIKTCRGTGTFPYLIAVEIQFGETEFKIDTFPAKAEEFELTNKSLSESLEEWRKEYIANDR